MQRYVSQPASGKHLGEYEVAVWDDKRQQYVSQDGPYFINEEEAKAFAQELNEDNKVSQNEKKL